MTSVAEIYSHVIGVDTHAKTHTFTIVDGPTGTSLETVTFPTSPVGLTRALSWVERHTPPTRLLVVEGIGSYGALLAEQASNTGIEVVEPGFIPKTDKAQGKNDQLDSIRIAKSVLGMETHKLRRPRFDQGIRDALHVLVIAREAQTGEKTRVINQLTALIRAHNLGLNAPCALSDNQIRTIAGWQTRNETLPLAVARTEATRLARRVIELVATLKDNYTQLELIIKATGYHVLLDTPGFGPVSTAIIITTLGTHQRVHSEAGFACLAGVNPIPASSGNTENHRLNRGGDRRLDKALTTIIQSRMTHHQQTRDYVERRTREGKNNRFIKRILKRYLARQIWRMINQISSVIP
jgi:transposase